MRSKIGSAKKDHRATGLCVAHADFSAALAVVLFHVVFFFFLNLVIS